MYIFIVFHPGVELLVHMVNLYLVFRETTKLLSKMVAPFPIFIAFDFCNYFKINCIVFIKKQKVINNSTE